MLSWQLLHFLVIPYTTKGYRKFVNNFKLEAIRLRRIFLEPTYFFFLVTPSSRKALMIEFLHFLPFPDSIANRFTSIYCENFVIFTSFFVPALDFKRSISEENYQRKSAFLSEAPRT